MSVLATDTFDRADAATLGANWGTQTGQTTQGITTNQATNKTTNNARCGNYYSAITWPDDQYSKAVINTALANEQEVGVRVRCSAAAQTYYAGGANFSDGGNDNHRIWKMVAGAFTSIATEAVNYTPGSTYELRAVGTTISLRKDGVQILSVTDVAIASGSAGLGVRVDTSDTGKSNDWEGGDFATSGHSLSALGVGT